jgi:hypothetical protein
MTKGVATAAAPGAFARSLAADIGVADLDPRAASTKLVAAGRQALRRKH